MKLTYFHEGAGNCPILRISETSDNDILKLIELWNSLATRKIDILTLNKEMDLDSNCILDCKVSEISRGIMKQNPDRFLCELTPKGWAQIIEFAEPLLNHPNSYQWLNETSEISLLLSPSGSW